MQILNYERALLENCAFDALKPWRQFHPKTFWQMVDAVADLLATSWIMENGATQPKYIGVINGFISWTDDISKALRLARRQDGDALAEIVEDCWSIRSHRFE